MAAEDARTLQSGRAPAAWYMTALEHTLRALAVRVRAPGLESEHDFDQHGPIIRTQLGKLLVALLRSESFLSDEAWAHAAILLWHTTDDIRPYSFWTDHHSSIAKLLGWAPRWEQFFIPISAARPRTGSFGFRSIDKIDPHDRLISAADRRMLARLLQIAKGWPRHGWLACEAAEDACGLLYAMEHTGNWAVRSLLHAQPDVHLTMVISQTGRRRSYEANHGNPLAIEASWCRDDGESDAAFQRRLSTLHPANLGGDYDDESDDYQPGLPWDAHPPLLVKTGPRFGPPFECGICFESLSDSFELGGARSLHCRCTTATPYHEVCLRKHLLRSNTCPLCRAAPASTPSAFRLPFH